MLRPYNEWAMNRENRAQKEKGQNRVKPQSYPRITIPQLKHFASVIFRKFYAARASRAALATDTGEPEWSAYSGALGAANSPASTPSSKKRNPPPRNPRSTASLNVNVLLTSILGKLHRAVHQQWFG